jgi:hypothetical protein
LLHRNKKTPQTIPSMLCIGIRIETVDTGPGWRVRLANADTFAQAPSEPADKRPLVVDLDGTLVKSDLLHESLFARVGRDPASVFSLLLALGGGKAHFKDVVASQVDLDIGSLPYDEAVLSLIEKARAAGRPVYLASASNEKFVAAVADQLGLFDGWFAFRRQLQSVRRGQGAAADRGLRQRRLRLYRQ